MSGINWLEMLELAQSLEETKRASWMLIGVLQEYDRMKGLDKGEEFLGGDLEKAQYAWSEQRRIMSQHIDNLEYLLEVVGNRFPEARELKDWRRVLAPIKTKKEAK